MAMQGLQPFELPESPPLDVEDGVRPLVEAINASGWIRTRQSCEGHPGGTEDHDRSPWVWVELLQADGLPRLCAWMDRVNAALPEWLVHATYLGQARGRLWFQVRGRYVNPELNVQILRALMEALA